MQKNLLVCIPAQEKAPDAEFWARLQLPQTFTETRIRTQPWLEFCGPVKPLKGQELKPQTKTPRNFGEHRNEPGNHHHQTLTLRVAFVIFTPDFKARNNLFQITYSLSEP